MQKLAVVILLGFGLLAGPAHAGFDEGLAAYNEGRFQTAIDEFIPLAEDDDARAQFYLGHILYFGYGREPDPASAIALYYRAAQQGHAAAQYSLGRTLFNGEGVAERDLIQGTHWIRRAAEQGLPEAQFNYAMLFRNGTGVPQDLGDAHFWCLLAERDANEELLALLAPPCAEIALRLTPSERFDAESRTWQWTLRLENPSIWPGEDAP